MDIDDPEQGARINVALDELRAVFNSLVPDDPALCPAAARRPSSRSSSLVHGRAGISGGPGSLRGFGGRLGRPDAYVAQTHPPDGDSENWWQRLKNALGTTSSDFVSASLLQVQAAARSPFGTTSETAMNAALAMVAAAAPKNEIEGALAVQMACTHTAAMAVLGNIDRLGTERRIALFASAASRLLRAHAMQMEVFRRLRNGGQQFCRVEHVHVNDGGQAIIGNVKKADR
jgi:hypothetical protein